MRDQSNGSAGAIPVLSSIADLARRHEAWLADVWGVMHNGVVPFVPACEACERFRQSGGLVVLLSNAPRPNSAVAEQLARIGVPKEAYDAIVTSGDVARALIRAAGKARIFHLGPERDLGLYEGIGAELVGPEAASLVVCSGLFDDNVETPDDYTALLADLSRRAIPMICANPDIFVERGSKLIYCAGAIAEKYRDMGSAVQFAGKPHLPVYDMAFEALANLKGRPVERQKTLAIGDGLRTDIAGAAAAGVPSLYIASNVHLKPGEALDAASLTRLFADFSQMPVAAMTGLAW